MVILDAVHRLEAAPAQADLGRGLAAEVADPAWALGRQWQLGEHLGEDASSPVRVDYTVRLTPVTLPDGSPDGADPTTTPAEALVESEPGQFWTPGRRVTAGRRVAAAAAAAGRPLPTGDPTMPLAGLPEPYTVLDGTGPDGRVLWERRDALDLDPAWFGDLRPPDPESVDRWDPAEFGYDAEFRAGGATLRLRRHDGGDLDWYSVDADGPVGAATGAGGGTSAGASSHVSTHTAFAHRVRFPGAPRPRWWQIEDARTDPGGHPPDRAHLATVLVVDLLAGASDDWFTFPVVARAGHVATLESVTVTDSFGDQWTVDPPQGWSLFATHGLGPRSLVVWGTAATPLAGPVLDEVVLGADEDANLVWAVERRLGGRDVGTPPDPAPPPPPALDATGRPAFTYRPMDRIPPHRHPYLVEEVAGRRRYVQGRAADLSGPVAAPLPAPASDLLVDPGAGGAHPVHQIEPAAVPTDGLRLERRAVLARRVDGTPVLWTQRRRHPLLGPPTLAPRVDVLLPDPAGPS